jgi:hypothetical protein
MSPSRFIVYSEVYFDMADEHPKATGLAEETVQGRGVNMTSALENCESSSIGRSLANCGYSPKGDAAKRPSREEMSKVAAKTAAQTAIEEAKVKMSQTSSEYVPIAKEDDPWTIREAAPFATVDEAVNLVKDIIGGTTEGDIPHCSKCHDHKPMTWKTGISGKTKKPWGNFSCYVCKDTLWYEISPNGTWQPQKNKW